MRVLGFIVLMLSAQAPAISPPCSRATCFEEEGLPPAFSIEGRLSGDAKSGFALAVEPPVRFKDLPHAETRSLSLSVKDAPAASALVGKWVVADGRPVREKAGIRLTEASFQEIRIFTLQNLAPTEELRARLCASVSPSFAKAWGTARGIQDAEGFVSSLCAYFSGVAPAAATSARGREEALTRSVTFPIAFSGGLPGKPLDCEVVRKTKKFKHAKQLDAACGAACLRPPLGTEAEVSVFEGKGGWTGSVRMVLDALGTEDTYTFRQDAKAGVWKVTGFDRGSQECEGYD